MNEQSILKFKTIVINSAVVSISEGFSNSHGFLPCNIDGLVSNCSKSFYLIVDRATNVGCYYIKLIYNILIKLNSIRSYRFV